MLRANAGFLLERAIPVTVLVEDEEGALGEVEAVDDGVFTGVGLVVKGFVVGGAFFILLLLLLSAQTLFPCTPHESPDTQIGRAHV